MEDNTEQVKQGDPQIEDLPNKERSDEAQTAQNAENVKGGGKKMGHDDDLDDLEVER